MESKSLEFKSDKSNDFEPQVNDIVWVFWLDREIWPATVVSEFGDNTNRKRYLCRFFDKKQ